MLVCQDWDHWTDDEVICGLHFKNIKGSILKTVILKRIMVKIIDTYQYFYTCTK